MFRISMKCDPNGQTIVISEVEMILTSSFVLLPPVFEG